MKTIYKILITCAIVSLLFLVTKESAAEDYDDVLLVVNENSTISEQIGTYFKTERSIPEINVCTINTTDSEAINETVFNDLRTQIETYIESNDLKNIINYIVTTKGVPLIVDEENHSSVDSELTLILGEYSNHIRDINFVSNPYCQVFSHFNSSIYGIYLVTRLTAYNYSEVKDLIDRAGNANASLSEGNYFILDTDPDYGYTGIGGYSKANKYMLEAFDYLNSSHNVTLNINSTYLTEQTNVMGYCSWGSNDHYDHLYTTNAIPNNTWVNGSIAETYVSTGARTFTYPPTYGQSLIADLIAEGATGVKGYVAEPFILAVANPNILFNRYTKGFNLAESFYMASRLLSWQDVIIGDPKTQPYTFNEPNDLTIEGDTYIANVTLILNGNLNIINNGTLTLENVTLKMNCTDGTLSAPQYKIYVDEYSTLKIYNSTITTLNPTSRYYRYGTELYGNITIDNCNISEMWKKSGLKILTENATITNNTILGHTYSDNGIVIYISNTSTILPNIFYNNISYFRYGAGIYVNGIASLIGNNVSSCCKSLYYNYDNEYSILPIIKDNKFLQGDSPYYGRVYFRGESSEWLNITEINNTYNVKDIRYYAGISYISINSNFTISDDFDYGSIVKLINATLDIGRFDDVSGTPPFGGEKRVEISWYLDVKALDYDGNPVNNAVVTIRDKFSTTVFTGLTSSNGYISTQAIMEYKINATGQFWYTNYTINITTDQDSNSTSINITESTTVTLSILPNTVPEDEDEDEDEDNEPGDEPILTPSTSSYSILLLGVAIIIIFFILPKYLNRMRR